MHVLPIIEILLSFLDLIFSLLELFEPLIPIEIELDLPMPRFFFHLLLVGFSLLLQALASIFMLFPKFRPFLRKLT